MRLSGFIVLAIVLCAIGNVPEGVPALVAQANPNAYFDSLNALPERMQAVSFRTQASIDAYSQGKPNKVVTYDPQLDAAQALIPAFMAYRTVGADFDARTDIIPLSSKANTTYTVAGRDMLIGQEVVTVKKGPNGKLYPDDTLLSVWVNRGQHGTAAVAHTKGEEVGISNNNLQNQLRVPIGTQDGHTYLFTWDVLYTSSYLRYGKGAKSYQLADQKDSLWFEVRMNSAADAVGAYPGFDRTQHIGALNARSYNTGLPTATGSNVSDYDPVTPQAGRYLVLPNRWIRTFVFLDQRPGELDRLSMWVADETTPPVLIFDNRTVSVRGTPPTVAQFWVELNTSQDDYRGSLAPLVSYVRNFVALKDVGSALPFLQQPGASKPITLQRPNAPTNVRIVPPFFQ